MDTNGFLIEDRVRDQVTGLEGKIVGITQWQTGCARATIQPPMTDKMRADGTKPPDAWSVDVLTLEMIERGPRHAAAPARELVGAAKGGPTTLTATRQPDAVR